MPLHQGGAKKCLQSEEAQMMLLLLQNVEESRWHQSHAMMLAWTNLTAGPILILKEGDVGTASPDIPRSTAASAKYAYALGVMPIV